MKPAFPPQARGEGPAPRFLLVLWLTSLLSALMIGIVAALALHLTAPLDLNPAFLAQLTVASGYLDTDQPAKTVAFERGCLATPFALALSYFIARAWVGKWSDSFLPLAQGLAIAISWLLILWCLSPLVYCPHPALEGMPPCWLLCGWFFANHPAPVAWRILCLGVGGVFGVFLLRGAPSRRNRRLAFLPLLALGALMLPSNVYTPGQISDDWAFIYHFNVVTHALSQVINGHHLLIQFPHLYGGYIEFLGPVLALFPRRVETLLLVFPLLNGVAVLSLLMTVRLVIRHPVILFITGLALLGMEFVPSLDDHYYAYAPIRTLFPAMGLLAAALFLRHPRRSHYLVTSMVAALAPWWNLETGIVLWASWTAALTARELGGTRWRDAWRPVAVQLVILAAVGIAFLLYLRFVSGRWPDLALLFTFQKLILGAGYFCRPMLVPDAWMMILATYLVGLVAACAFSRQRATSWRTPFLVMLSVLGVGLFAYFTGRSAESNLVAVSYPAILVMGLLLSETRTLMALGELPRLAWTLLLPVALILSWWAVVSLLALPNLLAQSGGVLANWHDAADTPFATNVAFLRQRLAPGEEVLMLSNQSGFYSYLSATRCPMDLPGPGELPFSRDMDRLITALKVARFPKLIVDQNFYTVDTYKPEIYAEIRDAVATQYRPVATSATGQVTLYVPR
jgi:hypothetical protein